MTDGALDVGERLEVAEVRIALVVGGDRRVTATGRSVYIKSAQRLRAQVGGNAPEGPAPAPKATKAARPSPAVAPDAPDVGPTAIGAWDR